MSHLALHCCCAPCTIEPLRDLAARYDRVTLVYYNPNIHPADEYDRRRDQFQTYATELGAEFVELEYDPTAWVEAVARAAADTPANERFNRCDACYALRLDRVARWAADNGANALATTLTVSPYQSQDGIQRSLERACASVGLTPEYRDYTDRYADATSASREMGMYRQNYCGCFLSKIEADAQRETRRAERAAAKAAKAAEAASADEPTGAN